MNNSFNISGSSITNLAGGDIHYQEVAQAKAVQADAANPPLQLPVKTILVLAANPKGTPQLRLDEEVREIQAGLERAKQRSAFKLQQRWAVRPQDVRRAMLDLQPQFVHFSGHSIGEPSDCQATATEAQPRKSTQVDSNGLSEGLYLESEAGQVKLVGTAALSGLFELFADRVECVLLNACYSAMQADVIAQHIPYVIGMTQAIGDRAAIEFAVGFYDALAAGESIEFSYRLGCSAIQMAGIPEHLTPVLKQRSNG